MRDLLCAFVSLCALLAPAVSHAQMAPTSTARAHSARRPPRVSRADRNELRRSLAMLSQGPSAPSFAPMRAYAPPTPSGASPTPAAAATGTVSQARVESALHAVERSGLIRRCWQHHLLRTPNEPGRSTTLSLRVDADGRWSALTLDVTDAPPLASCVTLGMRSLDPIAPGAPIVASAPIALRPGEP